MSLTRQVRLALIVVSTGMIMFSALTAAVAETQIETGPVDRKWGLGWDDGLTARLWLGGVWELAVTGGPNDYLNNRENQDYDTGYPPNWHEEEEVVYQEEKRESGFVRVQAGRLVSRRGPLALVCYSGLEYEWSDSRYSYHVVDIIDPDNSNDRIRDFDRATWTASLGIRPSFVILDFLTIETAFGLYYYWSDTEEVERRIHQDTGRVRLDLDSSDSTRFGYSGWNGMGSLQFMIWF
ncbi:MAG: hypothetical protein ABFS42_15520 [Candidatus Krumholzibacteriota bacterium]